MGEVVGEMGVERRITPAFGERGGGRGASERDDLAVCKFKTEPPSFRVRFCSLKIADPATLGCRFFGPCHPGDAGSAVEGSLPIRCVEWLRIFVLEKESFWNSEKKKENLKIDLNQVVVVGYRLC